jgi:uncharacterized membrane protein YtjA (UPF0391 family)
LTRRQLPGHQQPDARRQRRARDDDEREGRQIESDSLHELHGLVGCKDRAATTLHCGREEMARRLHQHECRKEGPEMLNYALLFLLVGLIAGALGLFGVAAVATQIAWVLFLIGAVLLLIHLATGRRTLTP